jgi:hypothetical protein
MRRVVYLGSGPGWQVVFSAGFFYNKGRKNSEERTETTRPGIRGEQEAPVACRWRSPVCEEKHKSGERTCLCRLWPEEESTISMPALPGQRIGVIEAQRLVSEPVTCSCPER